MIAWLVLGAGALALVLLPSYALGWIVSKLVGWLLCRGPPRKPR